MRTTTVYQCAYHYSVPLCVPLRCTNVRTNIVYHCVYRCAAPMCTVTYLTTTLFHTASTGPVLDAHIHLHVRIAYAYILKTNIYLNIYLSIYTYICPIYIRLVYVKSISQQCVMVSFSIAILHGLFVGKCARKQLFNFVPLAIALSRVSNVSVREQLSCVKLSGACILSWWHILVVCPREILQYIYPVEFFSMYRRIFQFISIYISLGIYLSTVAVLERDLLVHIS
mmetsp:Transcript_38656/g.75535  ORF Transcript_38656/g.75535 Transcript_38656/m.75535 type:complete len:226 (+) Transcript_38656:523-1200(+)